ncbi:DUF2071 domain-containing protein [Saccharopolyspora montiporae]|nr:DUF2071 domain-containing protein [Saccharopolyspora sp. HNM0983]
MLWEDPVFVHWPCDPGLVGPLLPPGTRPDLSAGAAWIGLVCLRIRCARVLGLPVLREPGLAEMNLRTYCVDRSGRRGLVFLAAGLSRTAPARAARLLGRLPARGSGVQHADEQGVLAYCAGDPLRSGLRVVPGGPAGPGAHEHFTTDRWRLFARWYAGRLLRVAVAHPPWSLRRGRLLDLDAGGMFAAAGLPVPRADPAVLCAAATSSRFAAPRLVRG